MLCSNPFVKKATGIKQGDLDATPFPCGQCFHCRVNQARIWQTRLLLESMTSYDSAFLTLTYDDDNLPSGGSLKKKDLQNFIKRYRKYFYPEKIRYFAIGEYGDETWRPHYHLAIFSEQRLERCWNPCKYMRARGTCTKDCYLSKAWKLGNVEISETLGKENAGYITGYIKKKATKEYRDNLSDRTPEFATMSRGYTDPETKEKITGGLGYEAIRRISEKYKNYPNTDQRVIRSLNFGDRAVPIGGYLESVLSNFLGVSTATRSSEFFQYSAGIIDKYLENGVLLTNMLADTEPKRHAREVKSKIYSKRKSL